MSIASELSALNGYILGAYDEVTNKGGTVPQNKNMANLATAIASISGGGGGGGVLCNMGKFSPTEETVYNIEHGLDALPTIWGLIPFNPLIRQSFVKYEAVQKIRRYNGSAVDQIDIYAYANATIGTGVNSNMRLYYGSLASSTVREDAATQWSSTYATLFPVNNKYIGVNAYTTSSRNAFIKVGVDYMWFAMADPSEL